MKKLKIDVYVTYCYGAWELTFNKKINMPDAPFYNMYIFENDDDYELDIHCTTDDYTRTCITYQTKTSNYLIDVRNIWKKPVREDVIDHILKKYSHFKWKRVDHTNIDNLKNLMKNAEKTT